MFKVKIQVTLKPGVVDPQGLAVQKTLRTMEYGNVREVRIGRYLELELQGENRDQAEKEVEEMCRRLLVNPVIEDYVFEVVKERT